MFKTVQRKLYIQQSIALLFYSITTLASLGFEMHNENEYICFTLNLIKQL